MQFMPKLNWHDIELMLLHRNTPDSFMFSFQTAQFCYARVKMSNLKMNVLQVFFFFNISVAEEDDVLHV